MGEAFGLPKICFNTQKEAKMSDKAALLIFQPDHIQYLLETSRRHCLFVHLYLFPLLAPFVQGDDDEIVRGILLGFHLQKYFYTLTLGQA